MRRPGLLPHELLDRAAAVPGAELRALRHRLGLTAKRVSELAGLHPKMVEKMERGAVPGSRATRLAVFAVLSAHAGVGA